MSDIDFLDCSLGISIGQRTRVSIYNHMRGFLITEIEKRGFAASDPKLFNMLTIEATAMDLAERLIREITDEAADTLDACIENPKFTNFRGAVLFAQEVTADGTLERLKQEFLADELSGIDSLIMLASGTPLQIGGAGPEINFGLGPDQEDGKR